MLMHKLLDKSVVKIEEKSVRKDVVTDAMQDKTVITMAYAKEQKMLVKDAVQMLRVTEITAELEAKIVKSRDKLIAMDLFKATTKLTTVIAATTAIVADTNRVNWKLKV
jgi:hypothetical protein